MNHKVETGIAPTKLVNAAIKLYYDGKIDDLFIRLSNLIKTYPNTYIFYNILGSIYFHKRLYTEAEKCFLKTIDLKPNHPYAYNNLGNLFMEISRIKEAEENLKYAIKLNNKYYEAYNNLGKLLQDTNRLEDSETNLRKALEIKGDVAATHYLLGITLFNLNKYEEAKLSFEQAIFLENNNSDYFNCLGMVFIKQKKIDEALQNYEKALELNCNNYRAQLNIGNVFFELGKFKSAKQSFRRALKINPDSPEINLSLAIFFDYFNDLVSASNYCKRTIERSKNEKGLIAAVNLAIIEYLKFNFSETKKYLKQSFEIIQKKTPLYKDAKVYHYYLTKLTDININQGRKIIPKISEKNLYVIGESHSLESHGLNINIKGEDFFCRSLLIIGCMQWDLGNKSRNKYKIKFEKVFFKLPKYSSILLAIGEIDCRIDSGILKYCGKFKKKESK